MTSQFFSDISKFNQLYKLECNSEPTLLPVERIKQFHDILSEEVEEGLEIAAKYDELARSSSIKEDVAAEVLTDMADWLGDLIVYCASEARRWGIPLEKTLDIIMSSNFSKLDENGKPIYDHRGKVMKGPKYWKPEEKIKSMIQSERSKTQLAPQVES